MGRGGLSIPGFLGEDYKDPKPERSSTKRRGSSTVAFQTYMDESLGKIESAITDASKTLASCAKTMNENGESNVGQISSKIDGLIQGFTQDEQIRILKGAISMMIASM